jgi:hypothetical protein
MMLATGSIASVTGASDSAWGREWTPQRAARLLPPPLRRVHPPPRTDPSISCRVHKPVVNQVRLPHQVLLGKIQHLQA